MICLLAGAAVILLAVLFINRDSAFFYQVYAAERIDGVEYIPNYLSGQVFVSGFEWDGNAAEVSAVIPDIVQLSRSSRVLRVTKLGGIASGGALRMFAPMPQPGSGCGMTFFPDPPKLETLQQRHPDAPLRDLTVDLYLGKNISELSDVSELVVCDRDAIKTVAIWRVHYRVDCDAENETFYSKDGKLYTRADDAPVELLPYGED